MNDTYIITAYVVIDDMLKAHGLEDDCRAIGSAAEILTVGIIAAKYFQNHRERALCRMTRLGYVHGLSVSRFNRRLHALRDWLYGILSYAAGEVFYALACMQTSASQTLQEGAWQGVLWLLCSQVGKVFL